MKWKKRVKTQKGEEQEFITFFNREIALKVYNYRIWVKVDGEKLSEEIYLKSEVKQELWQKRGQHIYI